VRKFFKNLGKGILIMITVVLSIWAIPIGGHMWGGAAIKLITEI
jgi:hypothetical protein